METKENPFQGAKSESDVLRAWESMQDSPKLRWHAATLWVLTVRPPTYRDLGVGRTKLPVRTIQLHKLDSLDPSLSNDTREYNLFVKHLDCHPAEYPPWMELGRTRYAYTG